MCTCTSIMYGLKYIGYIDKVKMALTICMHRYIDTHMYKLDVWRHPGIHTCIHK